MLSDAHARLNPKFKTECVQDRAMLIIVDRTLDFMAPLLHEFTYQAMLCDLVQTGLNDNKYTHRSDMSCAGGLI